MIPFNHFEAATKLPPLSEYTFCGLPLLAMKGMKLLMNSSVVWLVNRSKWDGSRETTCKQQNVGFPVLSFLADLVGNWTGVVNAHYLEWN